MRNLKRALSLVLAALMLIGMMVVGAGAAGVDDFTDRDEIVNKDAVSMLTILGVINGKEDGSYYAPQDNVTRAEMAKMIAIILNQGADVNDLYSNLDTGLTDISNNWAKGYINYCYSLGIIAGRGDGTFDPTAPVTGNEAAKMLLVAIGYDPAIEGLEGSAWAIKTTALASTLGIFDDLTAPTHENLNRDNAALLIYNALDVEMIQKYEDGYAVIFDDHRTLLSNKYGVYKVEGVVVANEWAQLQNTDSDAALVDGKTVLDDVVVYESTTSNTTVTGNPEALPVTFNVSTPVDMMGKAVTMYIKKTTILSNSTVLGVTLDDNSNTVYTSTANAETSKDMLKGTGLSVNANTEYYVNYGFCANADAAVTVINEYSNNDLGNSKATKDYTSLNGIPAEVIDNNGDGVADYVLYTMKTLSLVRSYNVNQETVGLYDYARNTNGVLTGNAQAFTLDFEDVVFNDEVATDDLVLYVSYGGRTYVELADIVTGTMSRVDRDANDELYITVDGTEYRQSYIPETASKVDADIDHFDVTDARNIPGFDTEYEFILDDQGYVAALRPAEAVVTNYALVLDSAWTKNALTTAGEVEILMADGTEGTYSLNWKGCYGTDKAFANEPALRAYLGTEDVLSGSNSTGDAIGSVIAYTLSDDGVLTIKKVLKMHDDVVLTANDGYVTGTTKNIGDGTEGITYAVTPATMQWDLRNDYSSGDASMDLTYTDLNNEVNNVTYAIDKNTVAFYYEDADNYGVAIGWDNMGDLDSADGVNVQVWPVEKKTSNSSWEVSKLAEVMLMDVAPEITSRDYMLVLNRNAYTSDDDLWLNVVFEDGTTAEVLVDNDTDYTFELSTDFMKAYAYVKNSDDSYTLVNTNRIGSFDANLLKVDTVDQNGKYFALPTTANVWDVTGVSTSGNSVGTGHFSFNLDVNSVIIPTTAGGNTIRTAFVWDKDDDNVVGVTPGSVEDFFLNLNNIIVVTNDKTMLTDLNRIINFILEQLKDQGAVSAKITKVGAATLASKTVTSDTVGAMDSYEDWSAYIDPSYIISVTYSNGATIDYDLTVILAQAMIIDGKTYTFVNKGTMDLSDASFGAFYRYWDTEANAWVYENTGAAVALPTDSKNEAMQTEIDTGFYGVFDGTKTNYAKPGDEVTVDRDCTVTYTGTNGQTVVLTLKAGDSFEMPSTNVSIDGSIIPGDNKVSVTATFSNAAVSINNVALTTGVATTINKGEDATLTVTANEGCTLTAVVVNGVDVLAQLVDGSYTIPAADTQSDVTITVVATNAATEATISAGEASEDYTVAGTGAFPVADGATVTVTPVEGKTIESAVVKNADGTISFTGVKQDDGSFVVTIGPDAVTAGTELTLVVTMVTEGGDTSDLPNAPVYIADKDYNADTKTLTLRVLADMNEADLLEYIKNTVIASGKLAEGVTVTEVVPSGSTYQLWNGGTQITDVTVNVQKVFAVALDNESNVQAYAFKDQTNTGLVLTASTESGTAYIAAGTTGATSGLPTVGAFDGELDVTTYVESLKAAQTKTLVLKEAVTVTVGTDASVTTPQYEKADGTFDTFNSGNCVAVGTNMKITGTSTTPGANVSLMNGDKVVKTDTVNADGDAVVYTFTANEDMTLTETESFKLTINGTSKDFTYDGSTTITFYGGETSYTATAPLAGAYIAVQDATADKVIEDDADNAVTVTGGTYTPGKGYSYTITCSDLSNLMNDDGVIVLEKAIKVIVGKDGGAAAASYFSDLRLDSETVTATADEAYYVQAGTKVQYVLENDAYKAGKLAVSYTNTDPVCDVITDTIDGKYWGKDLTLCVAIADEDGVYAPMETAGITAIASAISSFGSTAPTVTYSVNGAAAVSATTDLLVKAGDKITVRYTVADASGIEVNAASSGNTNAATLKFTAGSNTISDVKVEADTGAAVDTISGDTVTFKLGTGDAVTVAKDTVFIFTITVSDTSSAVAPGGTFTAASK